MNCKNTQEFARICKNYMFTSICKEFMSSQELTIVSSQELTIFFKNLLENSKSL